MADSLGIEKHCIVKVSDVFLVSFTCVEEARHVVCHTAILLCSQYRRHELLNARSVLFLVNHIETGNQIWVFLFSDSNMVDNLGDMRMSNNFVARQNQAHCEMRHFLLCLVNDLFDQSNFVQ